MNTYCTYGCECNKCLGLDDIIYAPMHLVFEDKNSRAWPKGEAPAFQAEYEGSIPLARSIPA